MRIRAAVGLVSGCALLALGVPPSIAQPVTPPSIALDGPFVHASGMELPMQVGNFVRTTVRRYDARGTDVSAGYALPNSSIVLTVFVYPMPIIPAALRAGSDGNPQASADANVPQQMALENQLFQAEKDAVLRPRPGAVELRSDTVLTSKEARSYRGYLAEFRYTDALRDGSPKVRSQLHYYPFMPGGWIVKYRITHSDDEDVTAAVDAFARDLAWTFTTAPQ